MSQATHSLTTPVVSVATPSLLTQGLPFSAMPTAYNTGKPPQGFCLHELWMEGRVLFSPPHFEIEAHPGYALRFLGGKKALPVENHLAYLNLVFACWCSQREVYVSKVKQGK